MQPCCSVHEHWTWFIVFTRDPMIHHPWVTTRHMLQRAWCIVTINTTRDWRPGEERGHDVTKVRCQGLGGPGLGWWYHTNTVIATLLLSYDATIQHSSAVPVHSGIRDQWISLAPHASGTEYRQFRSCSEDNKTRWKTSMKVYDFSFIIYYHLLLKLWKRGQWWILILHPAV